MLAEQFAHLARQIVNGVIFTDVDGNTLWINEGFASMSGYTLDELIGRHPGDVLQGAETAESDVRAMREAIAAQRPFMAEVLNYAKSGRAYWVHIDCFPMREAADGPVMGFMAIQTDITDRRRTEMALRDSAARFRNLFEHAYDAILIADDAGRYVDANPAACTLLGYPREELLTRTAFDITAPERAGTTSTRWQQFVADGVQRGELELIRKDGGTRLVEYNAVTNFHPGLHLSILRDVTTKRAAETELRRTDRLEALGTLAGGIAHDFNNILTGMLGQLDVIRSEVPEGSTLSASLEAITIGGERARALVRRILAYSRQHDATTEAMALGPVVREAMRLLRALLPAMVELEFAEAPGTPSILGDGTALHQIVMNLCTNAWQAMPDSGGRIVVRVGHGPVPADDLDLVQLNAPSLVWLRVDDNGRGMTQETRARIFEPFFTTKPAGHGTGLGLAGVQAIVAAHHGLVRVESEPDVGTTFTLWFPALSASTGRTAAAPAGSSAAQAAGRATLPRGQGERVVLVDDDKLTRDALERMVRHLGYTTETFANPTVALARVAESPATFDMLVTDLAMPGMSGDRLLAACREHRADLPVLVVSGFIADELRDDLRARGVTVLEKPPSLTQLAEALSVTLASAPTS